MFSGLQVDPEMLHQQSLKTLAWLDQTHHTIPNRWLQNRMQQFYGLPDARLQQHLWGLNFANPMGLAAGFDKDGVASGIWPSFGFGFAELGTVTYQAQPGNPRPRLFRLFSDEAVLNRMGFNNQGAAQMAETLRDRWDAEEGAKKEERKKKKEKREEREERAEEQEEKGRKGGQGAGEVYFPLGINLGKSKVAPLEDAATDYLASFRLLQRWGDYFVVNVSSPNTPGLRSLQDKAQLGPILQALQQENRDRKPLLVKIAPDLEWGAIADVLELAQTHQLAGIIATNTTIRRDNLKTQILSATGNPLAKEAGGISGAPLRQRSTEVIRFIWQQTQGQLPIIGVGGVFTAEDAWEKIIAGASLIQVYTGWIYEGPWMVRRILAGLVQKLEQHGLSSIGEAIGGK